MKLAIYLAGTIKKGHENSNETHWGDREINALKEALHPYEVSFLNPAFRSDNLSDPHSVFGRDMLQVFSSHVIFVDARDRRGLGVGAEMMWGKVNRIPVVTWAPKNTHYHMSKAVLLGKPVEDYIHPFVYALSDVVVETLEEGAKWIKKIKEHSIKGPECMHAAMQYYKDSQLSQDRPMQDLMINCDELKTRVHTLAR